MLYPDNAQYKEKHLHDELLKIDLEACLEKVVSEKWALDGFFQFLGTLDNYQVLAQYVK